MYTSCICGVYRIRAIGMWPVCMYNAYVSNACIACPYAHSGSLARAQTICYIRVCVCLCLIENLVKSKLQSPNYSVVFLVVIIHCSLCRPSKSYRALVVGAGGAIAYTYFMIHMRIIWYDLYVRTYSTVYVFGLYLAEALLQIYR